MNEILLSKLLGLFALMAVGYGLRQAKLINSDATSGLGRLVVDVCMPCLFFIASLEFSWAGPSDGLVAVGGFGMSVLGLLIGYLIARVFGFSGLQLGTFLFLCSVGNSSFLPIPLSDALLGQSGVRSTILYILSNNIYIFSIGIALFSMGGIHKNYYKTMLFRVIAHPQSVAFWLGLSLHFIGFRPPAAVLEPISALGKTTLPLAMVCTGCILAGAGGLRTASWGLIGVMGGVKLVLLPLIVYLAFKDNSFSDSSHGVLLLQAAMPCLASAGVYAQRFGGDAKLAAQGSLFTHVLAIFTLIFWLSFIR